MRTETPDPALNGPKVAPRPAGNAGQPSRQGGVARATPLATVRPVGSRQDTAARADLPAVVVPGRLFDVKQPVAIRPSRSPAVPVSLQAPRSDGVPASLQAPPSAVVPTALPAAKRAAVPVALPAPKSAAAPSLLPAPKSTAAASALPASKSASTPGMLQPPRPATAPDPVHVGRTAPLPVQAPAAGGPDASLPAWLATPLPALAPAPAPRASALPAAPRRPGPGLEDRLRTAWFELQRLLGLSGAIGIGLLLAGAALLTGLAPALQQNARQLTTAAATSRDERAQQRVEQLSAPSGAEVVQRFVEGFPPATQQVDDLAFLVQQAKAAGVQLARADYQMRTEATLGLVRYQVNLPVQARYATLRRFVAAVLNARPNAALDELTLERKEGDDIEARVRFTFVYRSGDGQ
jgi:hypothetical protein